MIEDLENSISSQQKLWELAMQYLDEEVGGNYELLMNDLLAYNYEYGSSLERDVIEQWENALMAFEQYASAVETYDAYYAGAFDAPVAGQTKTVAPNGNYSNSYSSSDLEKAKANHNSGDKNETKSETSREPKVVKVTPGGVAPSGLQAGDYVVTTGGTYRMTGSAVNGKYPTPDQIDDYVVGDPTKDTPEERYKMLDDRLKVVKEKVQLGIYHTGGIVGDKPTLKQNEMIAKLEHGEMVLDLSKQDVLAKVLNSYDGIVKRLGSFIQNISVPSLSEVFGGYQAPSLAGMSAGSGATVTIGDTYIYGSDESTLRKHEEISRRQINEVLKVVGIRR